MGYSGANIGYSGFIQAITLGKIHRARDSISRSAGDRGEDIGLTAYAQNTDQRHDECLFVAHDLGIRYDDLYGSKMPDTIYQVCIESAAACGEEFCFCITRYMRADLRGDMLCVGSQFVFRTDGILLYER